MLNDEDHNEENAKNQRVNSHNREKQNFMQNKQKKINQWHNTKNNEKSKNKNPVLCVK